MLPGVVLAVSSFAEKSRWIATLVVLLFVSRPSRAGDDGRFIATGSMTTERSQHAATLLRDGRVLITGGSEKTAELYDPARGTFVATGSMQVGRSMHSSTLLPDGRVLVAGGWGNASAEIYDPETGRFSRTGDMLEEQAGHAAILLPTGKVLITGGEGALPPFPTPRRAELYDPDTGAFAFAGAYAPTNDQYGVGAPIWPTANLLPDGRVLIVGQNPPQIYDAATDTFTVAGPMINSRYRYGTYWHNSPSLADGSVLVTGGNDDFRCEPFDTAEIYDPSTGLFSAVSNMTGGRNLHTSTLLRDGTILITGGGAGWCGANSSDTAELYQPRIRSFVAAGRMTRSRSGHTATPLGDGTVLIAGGFAYWPRSVTRTAELYRPAYEPTDATAIRISLRTDRSNYVGAENCGNGRVTANATSAGPCEIFKLYDANGGQLVDGDQVYLQSSSGNFITAEEGGGSSCSDCDGAVNANRWVAGAWETFTIRKIGGSGAIASGDRITLQSSAGDYMAAENGGWNGCDCDSVLHANRRVPAAWETFTIEWDR
jgi:hypothetical protein